MEKTKHRDSLVNIFERIKTAEVVVRCTTILIFSLWSGVFGILSAQTDSTALFAEALDTDDIFFLDDRTEQADVISISGKDKLLFESAQTVYLITKEEIRQNAYTTLTDVLRMVPGMLVSPYGSAREGELFMQHGLRGNRMADVMINGVSVKPLMLAGMPLGATLPIRQAERIEVYTSPGGINYLAGANGGVINIVLKDTERPITTQADLTIGENRYNNIDVLFGGKLGRGKRIIKFTAWGAATSFEDWNTGVYSPLEDGSYTNLYDNYYGNQRYLQQPNYLGDEDFAAKNGFPHQSRHLGLRLQYNKLELIFDYRYRRDHSALGLNPLTVSYSNPVSYFAQTTSRIHVKRKMGNKRFASSFDAALMVNALDPESSYQPIQSHIGHAYETNLINQIDSSGVIVTNAVRDSVYLLNQTRNFEGSKYRTSFVFQATIYNNYSLRFNKNYAISFGPGIILSLGLGEMSFLNQPYNGTQDAFTPTNLSVPSSDYFTVSNFDDVDGGAFLFFNNEFTFDKWRANLGIKRSINNWGGFWTPRANASFDISSKLNFRVDYSFDQWLANNFYTENTFFFGEDIRRQFANFFLWDIYPQTTTSAVELGMRWNFGQQNNFLDVLAFSRNTQNLMVFETRPEYPFSNDELHYSTGYFTDGGESRQVSGIQAQAQFFNLFKLKNLNSRMGVMFSRGFDSHTSEVHDDLDRIPDYPSIIAQWRLSYAPGNWYFAVENILHNTTLSAAYHDQLTSPKINTDFIFRYELSRNFDLLFKSLNIFNVQYFGIAAEENIDALYFNIQPSRRFRIGVSYRLD